MQIPSAALKKAATALSQSQFACLTQAGDDMLPEYLAALVLTADVFSKTRLFTESESILVLSLFRPQFLSQADDFALAIQGGVVNPFQVLVVNPWSKIARATCTGRTNFVCPEIGTTARALGMPAFVSMAINATALLVAAWPKMTVDAVPGRN